jgi:MFS family permease
MENKTKLSKNVIVLGLVSFFNDFASEMVYPIVPIFLTTVLGAPVSLVGLIEGIAEATASILKVFSGWLSDKAQKRKIFTTYGYILSTLSKLIIGIAMGWPLVLLGRFIDRFGKGIRDSARDALITESTAPEIIGKAFGFHRALDTAGAVVGPLVAILFLNYYSSNLRPLFFIAFIPGVIGVILLVMLVKETPFTAKLSPPQFKLAHLTPDYKIYLVVSAIFALGNSSDAFLILRAKNLGLSTTYTILAYVFFNLVYALLSTSAGSLSDRIGQRKILAAGFFLFALIYLLIGINQSTVWLWGLFALYGVYMAMTEGISRAYITHIASKEVIATSFGAYQTIMGVCTFFASLFAGLLWSGINPSAPFIFGAILALIAGIMFVLLVRRENGSTVEP